MLRRRRGRPRSSGENGFARAGSLRLGNTQRGVDLGLHRPLGEDELRNRIGRSGQDLALVRRPPVLADILAVGEQDERVRAELGRERRAGEILIDYGLHADLADVTRLAFDAQADGRVCSREKAELLKEADEVIVSLEVLRQSEKVA